MPNHVKNRVEITGNIKELKKLHKQMGEKEFDFNKLLPMPAEIKNTTSPSDASEDQKADLIKKFGFDNWYDWACENWGTKWNAYDQCEPTLDEDEPRLIYDFSTAWSMPEGVALALAKAYPKLQIVWSWADEDLAGGNCGVRLYKNGQLFGTRFGDEQFAEEMWGWNEDGDLGENYDQITDFGETDDQKHNNYKNPAVITIRKSTGVFGETYELSYDDENWTFMGSKEEILAEIGEHLDLIVVKNTTK